MPRIIDYFEVQQRMQNGGFVSLYHNSGAFGFPQDVKVQTIGWVGPDDPTIRPSARSHVRPVAPPYPASLAEMLRQAHVRIGGEAWLMPKSHWHYELHFGNRELLEATLPAIGIEASALRDRNSGDAIAFAPREGDPLCETAERLLTALRGSDFLLAFPEHRTACTIHHHQQLWWQTADDAVAAAIRACD